MGQERHVPSHHRGAQGPVLRIDKKACNRDETALASLPDSSLMQKRRSGSESILLREEEAQWAVVPWSQR